MWIAIILFSVAYALITFRKLEHGLILLFTLLPAYLIRFSIGPLPTTLLEVMIWILGIAWLTKIRETRLKEFFRENKLFSAGMLLFVLGATISIFTSVDTRAALGEWKAFYIEPIIVFLILVDTVKEKKNLHAIITGLLFSGLSVSILAIYQHFTGWMVPHAFWANRDTYRVTAWYGFPNAVGLFLAPLCMLAIYMIIETGKRLRTKIDFKKIHTNFTSIAKDAFSKELFADISIFKIAVIFIPLSFLAIFYAKSTGAIIGIVAGIGVLLLLYKKTRWWIICAGIIGCATLILLPTAHPIKQELLLQDRSGQIRIAMWKETTQFLKDNTLLGAGLASYSKKIEPYHTTVNGEGIEIFHHPHNIFLTMWVNLGLIGLVGFVLIILSPFVALYTIHKERRRIPFLSIASLAALVTILTTGLVDSPYIKNDLSVLFWFVVALCMMHLNYFPTAETKKNN